MIKSLLNEEKTVATEMNIIPGKPFYVLWAVACIIYNKELLHYVVLVSWRYENPCQQSNVTVTKVNNNTCASQIFKGVYSLLFEMSELSTHKVYTHTRGLMSTIRFLSRILASIFTHARLWYRKVDQILSQYISRQQNAKQSSNIMRGNSISV